MRIAIMAEEAHRNAVAKGWWDEAGGTYGALDKQAVMRAIPEKLCLAHSEISEALEAYRTGGSAFAGYTGEGDKPEGFLSEVADAIIRLAELTAALGWHCALEDAIRSKMNYNATRPHRHGGKAC